MPDSQVIRANIADKTTLDIAAGKASNLSSTTSSQATSIDTIKGNLETSNTSIYESILDASDVLDSITSKVQPKIIVMIESGVTVTATKDGTTVTKTTDATGKCELNLPEVGTWAVSATDGTDTTGCDVTITNSQWVKTIYLEFFSATLNVNVDAGAVVTISHNGEEYTETADVNGIATFTIKKHGNYIVTAMKENASSDVVSVDVTTDGNTYSANVTFRKINVTVVDGASVTLTNGSKTITFTSDGNAHTVYIPNDGTWNISATLDGDTTSDSIDVESFTTYSVELSFAHIYGVEWAGTSDPSCTRTDESALFSDPDPYMADGSHPGSSPFDTLMPWSGMVKETIGEDVFVKIPKFWFKITKDGAKRKIQIADNAVDGFMVSPAHQDRGDGVGERDFVYVGRYHSISGYKSQSGAQPLTNITRAGGRSNIKNLGTGFYLWDYATLVTIWLLYIVEFANWNSQTCIGYGCSSGNAKYNTGATSSMTYHTGTTATSRTSYASGCQYRYIEDLWGNVYDWVDGIRFSSRNIYVYKNPSEFSDSSGGINTGTRPTSSRYISSWTQPSTSGYDWAIYPGAVNGSDSTYVPDYCYYGSSGVVLRVGGGYGQGLDLGLFCLGGNDSASVSLGFVGVRVMYLPS